MRLMGMIFATLATLAMFSTAPAQAGDGAKYAKQKVVYHINYNDGAAGTPYKGALKNIQNHINAVGAKNLDIKVVLHGNGVGLLKAAKDAGTAQILASQNAFQESFRSVFERP